MNEHGNQWTKMRRQISKKLLRSSSKGNIDTSYSCHMRDVSTSDEEIPSSILYRAIHTVDSRGVPDELAFNKGDLILCPNPSHGNYVPIDEGWTIGFSFTKRTCGLVPIEYLKEVDYCSVPNGSFPNLFSFNSSNGISRTKSVPLLNFPEEHINVKPDMLISHPENQKSFQGNHVGDLNTKHMFSDQSSNQISCNSSNYRECKRESFLTPKSNKTNNNSNVKPHGNELQKIQKTSGGESNTGLFLPPPPPAYSNNNVTLKQQEQKNLPKQLKGTSKNEVHYQVVHQNEEVLKNTASSFSSLPLPPPYMEQSHKREGQNLNSIKEQPQKTQQQQQNIRSDQNFNPKQKKFRPDEIGLVDKFLQSLSSSSKSSQTECSVSLAENDVIDRNISIAKEVSEAIFTNTSKNISDGTDEELWKRLATTAAISAALSVHSIWETLHSGSVNNNAGKKNDKTI